MACDLVVETSAIVAILLRESDTDRLVARIEEAAEPVTTPLAAFEAALVIASRKGIAVASAAEITAGMLDVAGIAVVPVTGDVLADAASAADRFGKGRGHPARLNLCDCVAYAVSRRLRAPLLYVGEDFSRTDVANAVG